VNRLEDTHDTSSSEGEKERTPRKRKSSVTSKEKRSSLRMEKPFNVEDSKLPKEKYTTADILVAIERNDVRLIKCIKELEKHLTQEELKNEVYKTSQDGRYYLLGAARQESKKQSNWNIHFDYTSKYLPIISCSTQEVIDLHASYRVLAHINKQEADMTKYDEEKTVINDPTQGRKWMYDKEVGEECTSQMSIGSNDEENIHDMLDDFFENMIGSESNNNTVKKKCMELKGLTWESNVELKGPKLPETKGATLKTKTRHMFETPIGCIMAFTPTCFYIKITQETNKYALTRFDYENKGFGNFRLHGVAMRKVTLKEIFQFHGILINMMLYPYTGRPFSSYWSQQRTEGLHSFTKIMSLKRFTQIRSCLSFSSGEKNNDALFKIRPILNMLKKTIGFYVNVGSDVSLDEATFANRSSYGGELIYFNPKKPAGKFHFKMYAICCPYTSVMVRMRFATRDTTETADAKVEGEDDLGDRILEEVNTHPKGDLYESKIDSIVLDMCRYLPKMTVVNMDNWYTSIPSCIALRDVNVYVRGTLRANRMLLPKKIALSNSEKIRGFRKIAVNQEHGITAISWMDKKPVLMLSTADGTSTEDVVRKEGRSKVVVPALKCIAQYNKRMGGVDRHDELRNMFSLHRRHKFMKYYKSLYFCVFDVALTNALLHYKLRFPESKKNYESHAEFFEDIATCFLSTNLDWLKDHGNHGVPDDVIEENDPMIDMGVLLSPNKTKNKPTIAVCQYALPHADHCHRGSNCQVCAYELRPSTIKNVRVCLTHKVRLCQFKRDDVEDKKLLGQDWICPNMEWTCDQKFHNFYLPNGIFGSDVKDKTMGTKFYFNRIQRNNKHVQSRRDYIESQKSSKLNDNALDADAT